MSLLKKTIHYILLVILLLYSNAFAYAQVSASSEYQLKAVFLFNFTQFVEWPAATFPAADTPFIIGILGKDPFGNYLNETINGEKVNGHALVVEHYNTIEELKICHILFITSTETDK